MQRLLDSPTDAPAYVVGRLGVAFTERDGTCPGVCLLPTPADTTRIQVRPNAIPGDDGGDGDNGDNGDLYEDAVRGVRRDRSTTQYGTASGRPTYRDAPYPMSPGPPTAPAGPGCSVSVDRPPPAAADRPTRRPPAPSHRVGGRDPLLSRASDQHPATN